MNESLAAQSSYSETERNLFKPSNQQLVNPFESRLVEIEDQKRSIEMALGKIALKAIIKVPFHEVLKSSIDRIETIFDRVDYRLVALGNSLENQADTALAQLDALRAKLADG